MHILKALNSCCTASQLCYKRVLGPGCITSDYEYPWKIIAAACQLVALRSGCAPGEFFSKAAEELHITQAAISRQIRGLEEDLGLKLFCRRNRAVFLTPPRT
nr:hypothetical protein GCM10020185_81430 [Pseudomonas brassicacearum subsp. brassicacearum]